VDAKVLVTGGSGFVGGRVVHLLQERGASVISLDRRPSSGGSFQSIAGDITDPTSFSIPEGLDTIVHCAGILESSHAGKEALFKINLEGTKRIYAKAKEAGAERFVLMSTIMAVGPLGRANAPMDEETEPRPDEPYGESKLLAERFLMEHGPKDGIDIMIIRPPVIYGEGMSEHSSAMRTFISIRKGIMPLVDEGRHRFNMLYIGNLASAIVQAVYKKDALPGIYHVNEGPYTLREVISTISKEMGVAKGYIRIPKPLFYLASRLAEATSPLFKSPPPLSMTKYRAITMDVWNMDASKARDLLGFIPPFTFEEGVRSTCSHYGWNAR
jgi:nucleoside-diphosphate-sugar epimerase